MKTFSIQTLGCKVNQYEGDQLAALLRSRGLTAATDPASADLRVVHTCSVTTEAASKSRQLARRATRGGRVVSLPQLTDVRRGPDGTSPVSPVVVTGGGHAARSGAPSPSPSLRRPRVIVTGCWATSDPAAAAAIAGVDAVVGHRQDVAAELDRLLTSWGVGGRAATGTTAGGVEGPPGERAGRVAKDRHGVSIQGSTPTAGTVSGTSFGHDGRIDRAGTPAGVSSGDNKPTARADVNANLGQFPAGNARRAAATPAAGTTRLPLLGERQPGRQRAVLKVQDGCDARCTYCIIPALRPGLWSKPVDDAVGEARRLVEAGHVEVVLTGIFLGAYGQPTALCRRQPGDPGVPLAGLVDALCTRVPGLRRLRLSSLEPGDLTADLVAALRGHAQVVPHFHLPLQSGSDALLRRMNRQYTRDDFRRMVDRVRAAFDRPALTTDVIAGFPGESDAEFARTLEAVDEAAFVHVHAFPYSPRPGTAAARWTRDAVPPATVRDRVRVLRERGERHGLAFRRQFVGETVELLVEHEREHAGAGDGGAASREGATPGLRHGRCERYFGVWFDADDVRAGDFVRVRVDRVESARTAGTLVRVLPPPQA